MGVELPIGAAGDGTPAVAVLVLFHSRSGNTLALAEAVAAGAATIPGARVTLRRVPELRDDAALLAHPHTGGAYERIRPIQVARPEDVVAADVIVLGSPCFFGAASGEMKHFLDGFGQMWVSGVLRGKVGAAFTSAATPHGGQEMTLMGLLTVLMHWGLIIVTPGYADPIYDVAGSAYGAAAVTKPMRVRTPPAGDALEAATALGWRVATVGRTLALGRAVLA